MFFKKKKQKGNSIKGKTDEEIIQAIVQDKNSELYRILYERYAEKVYHKCLSFTSRKRDAEDMAHDIFLKVYLSLPKFKQKSSFSTWLYAITYNFCIDYKRKADKSLMDYLSYSVEEQIKSEEPSDEQLFNINAEQLKALLDQIKPEEKALLLMKYQDDFSIKEIQNVSKLSKSAIKMRLKRAKEKIVKKYDNIHYEK